LQKIIFISIIGLFIAGCNVFQHERKVIPYKESTLEVSVNSIVANNLTKDNFNIQKAEIQYIEDGTTINLIASLKFRSDRNYLISLRSRSGIEIARIHITKDTILVNDRINKKLYYGSSDYLKEKYGITADVIPLVFGDLIIDANEEKIVECKEGISEITGNINSKNIGYIVDCNEKKVSDINFESYKGASRIKIKLRNFQNLEGKIFPEIIELTEAEDKSEIRIRVKKIEFNTEEEINFIPGTNYEKIMVK
jgi:hypothetical protein